MIFFLFIGTISVYLFLNLGNFMDVTKMPQKADIIVSLGGDQRGYRIKKALSLYKKGISNSKILIYTGPNDTHSSFNKSRSKKQYLLNQNLKNKNIFHIREVANTMEEIFFIKKYMLYNNYKSVLFVSHPHHSRRIEILANVIAGYKDNNLNLSVASCNPVWWEKDKYYTNIIPLAATIKETVKLIYNLVKYTPLLIKYTDYSKRDREKQWNNILSNNNFSVE